MSFVSLEKIAALKNGYRKTFKVGGKKLLLLHVEGKSYLVDERCPHAEASLAKGKISGHCLRCPKHGIVFDLETGTARGGEAVAEVPALESYALIVRDDCVGVEV